MALVVKLYRALLKCVQSSQQLYPSVSAIHIREPPVGEIGSFSPISPASEGGEIMVVICC